MKLSKVQRETLAKMEVGKRYSAHDLQRSLGTMKALERYGLVGSRRTPNYFLSPRTDILFRLTDAGQELKRAGIKLEALKERR